jgi:L-lactate dehydrogenase complex protein LldG
MDALYSTFKERAEAVSAEVHRVASEAVPAFLARLLGELGGQALWAAGPYLEAAGRPVIPGLSFEVTREAAARAAVGISQMDWAVADTGTLVQDATGADQRLVSSLPPVHVALVAMDRLLPDLAAVLGKLRPEQAGYLAMITGPSRTADIERVLTIGAHGPERLIILFVEGMPS